VALAPRVGMNLRSAHTGLGRALRWPCAAAAALAVMALLLLCGQAQAAPICHWVDAAGGTQFAKLVPEQYRKVATCIASHNFELSAEQRRAAEQRAAEDDDKARARRASGKPAAAADGAAAFAADHRQTVCHGHARRGGRAGAALLPRGRRLYRGPAPAACKPASRADLGEAARRG
jgi:hypothetical protein